jgi:hypothetical protein
MREAFAILRPCHGEFNFAAFIGQIGFAGEMGGGQRFAVVQRRDQEIFKTAGKMEFIFGGCFAFADQASGAAPADFNTRIQISLGTGHLVKPAGFEMRLGAKNFRHQGGR